MQQLAVKAAVSEVTDLGEFEAIAATYDIDRVKDQIVFGAFAKTIAAWRRSGKRLPVHWNNSGASADIIGAVNPATMREIRGKGLFVKGRLDLQDSEGRSRCLALDEEQRRGAQLRLPRHEEAQAR